MAHYLTPAVIGGSAVTRMTELNNLFAMGSNSGVTGRKLYVLETGTDGGIRIEANAAGDTALDALVTGDAAARYSVLQSGVIFWGDGAGAPDTSIFRGAANRLDVATGDSLNLVSGTFLIGNTILFEADRDLAVDLVPNADATLNVGTPTRRFHGSFATVNFGDGAANDVQLSRGAANRLDLATGDSFNIVSGDLLIAGTILFESDRDLAVTLLPNADNTLALGSAGRRFSNVFAATTTIGDLKLQDRRMGSSWTVREAKIDGEDVDVLYAINERTGKKFRLSMRAA